MSVFQGINEQFYKDIAEKISSVEEVLLKGNFKTLDDYKKLVGERAGLIYSVERHKELISLMEND